MESQRELEVIIIAIVPAVDIRFKKSSAFY